MREKLDFVSVRLRTRMSQMHFWGKIGVSCSTGCKYERSGDAPQYIVLLVQLYYGEYREDIDMMQYLKKTDPDYFCWLQSRWSAEEKDKWLGNFGTEARRGKHVPVC